MFIQIPYVALLPRIIYSIIIRVQTKNALTIMTNFISIQFETMEP